MKSILLGCLVCLYCTVVQASTPPWMMAAPCGNGVLVTKPDANKKCWYHVRDQSFAIRVLHDAEIEEEKQFFGWTIKVKRKVKPEWMLDVQSVTPPDPLTHEQVREMLQINEMGIIDPRIEVSAEELQKAFIEKNEEQRTEWRRSINDDYTKICGTATEPNGFFVIITQRCGDNADMQFFVVDEDTGSIWKQK